MTIVLLTLYSLWNYYRNEVSDAANENNDDDYRVNNDKTRTSNSFGCKTKKKTGSTPDNSSRLGAEIDVPSKYLNNFWRSLDLSLIKCKIELDSRWIKNSAKSEIPRTDEVPSTSAANPPTDHVPPTETIRATFPINNAKFYLPVVTLPINETLNF